MPSSGLTQMSTSCLYIHMYMHPPIWYMWVQYMWEGREPIVECETWDMLFGANREAWETGLLKSVTHPNEYSCLSVTVTVMWGTCDPVAYNRTRPGIRVRGSATYFPNGLDWAWEWGHTVNNGRCPIKRETKSKDMMEWLTLPGLKLQQTQHFDYQSLWNPIPSFPSSLKASLCFMLWSMRTLTDVSLVVMILMMS